MVVAVEHIGCQFVNAGFAIHRNCIVSFKHIVTDIQLADLVIYAVTVKVSQNVLVFSLSAIASQHGYQKGNSLSSTSTGTNPAEAGVICSVF